MEPHAAVLGSMIIDPECIAEVAEKLTVDMFPDMRHRYIWDAIMALDAENSTIDLLTLKVKMADNWDTNFCVAVAESVPSAASAMYYADIVLEVHRNAEIKRLASDVARIASGKETASEKAVLVDRAVRDRTDIDAQDNSRVMHVREVEVSFEAEDNRVLKTQFDSLNAHIMGFGPTELVGVLGATSMGKTSLMIDFLLHFGYHQEVPSAFFSCELTNEENMKRMCCNLSDKNYVSITNGFCPSSDIDELYQTAAKINMKPIFLNKTPGLNPSDLRRKLTSLHRREGIKIAFVDHLHNMETDKECGSRRLNLSYMIRSVKNIAVELEIPIVLGIQTNRNPSNEKRHAELYDAEECGSIEQNLDKCLSPFRPSNYGLPGPDKVYELKGRNCAKCSVEVEFLEQYSSFRPARNNF